MEVFMLSQSVKIFNRSTVTFTLLTLAILFVSPGQLKAEDTAANTFAIKGKISGSIEDAPQNVQDVLYALITALRGELRPDHFGPVVFDGDNLLRIRKAEGTFYAGFDVKSIQISYIGHKPDNTVQFIGRILWEDAHQRRAATAFTVAFSSHPDFTLIKHAAVSRMPPNTPRVVTFLVPEKKVQKKLKVAKEGYIPLLELVAKNAVSPDNPPFFLRGKHDYLLFTFSLDRLAKGGRIDYIIGGDKPEKGIRPKQQKRIDYAGWQVLILATTLNIRDKNSPQYRVFYTPTAGHPRLERKPYLVSAFKLSGK